MKTKHKKVAKPVKPNHKAKTNSSKKRTTNLKSHKKSSKKNNTSKQQKVKNGSKKIEKSKKRVKKTKTSLKRVDHILDEYKYESGSIPIKVTVIQKIEDYVPHYNLEISVISKTTEVILEKVRQELIRRVNLGIVEISDTKKTDVVEGKFEELIDILIKKYFPDSDDDTSHFLKTYLKMKSLGLGNLELLMSDENLEEIVINQASEPAWVYHKKHGWLKTNIFMKNEEEIRHYAAIIGRKVGRQITVLNPLLDAHLTGGDRVNATLNPVSTAGNTITIRKFTKDPWTITKFLKTRTITAEAAAIIWTAIQYEMSAIISGGTASGKTSALNVFSNFFPPNHRVISIEDTREITLPKFLHWVPLNTVLANAEGKGKVLMQDLLVNSLRMRPDRILVGEVRRSTETETLFEAIHTGHSVYATFHSNSAKETVERLTNPPINVPKMMLPAISLIIVQFRNRRTGLRRTFQVAEIMPDGNSNVLMQYNAKKDILEHTKPSKGKNRYSKTSSLFANIQMFTGMTEQDIMKDLAEKVEVLNYLVKHDITNVDDVGKIIAEYYTNKDELMKNVRSNKVIE